MGWMRRCSFFLRITIRKMRPPCFGLESGEAFFCCEYGRRNTGIFNLGLGQKHILVCFPEKMPEISVSQQLYCLISLHAS